MQPAGRESRGVEKPAQGRAAWLVALFAAALYSPTLRYGLTTWDDPPYVLTNPLTASLDPQSIGRIFSHFYEANYIPLTFLTYALVRAAAGTQPWAYHLLNVALHALCAGLAFRVLGKLRLPPWSAVLGACVFAAHPAQVEVVAWVSQTKTLLATALGLCALLALLRWRDARAGGAGAGWYVASCALFVCAMLSKPQAVAFPGLFFCAERSLPDRPGRIPAAAWIPFAVLAIAGAWVGALAQADVGAIKAYGPMGPAGNLLASLILLGRYFRIAFFPADLSVVYELRPPASPLDPRLLGSALLLALIALAAWKYRRSYARPWHALGWFVAPLVPVLGLVPLNVPMAERYLYPSLLGLGWLLGAFGAGSSTEVGSRAHGARDLRAGVHTRARWPVRALLWTAPALFALLALARMPAWRDADAVWNTAVRDHPDRIHAWIGRGARRFDAGDAAGAEGDFRHALALDPEDFEAWTNLGLALNRQGKTDAAMNAWRRALAAEPRADWPRLLIARDLSRRGRSLEAFALYDAVIRERPGFAMARLYRAAARERAGDGRGAEADLARAAALDPFLSEAHLSLGRVREARGDLAGARRAYIDFLRNFDGDPAVAFSVRKRLEAVERAGGR